MGRAPLRVARRKPLQDRPGARVSRPKVVSPPVGGWNARDALDLMGETDAVRLINWFPRQSDCITRPGYSLQCDTGESGSTVRTLVTHEYAAVNKLLAAVNGKLIDVTTSTPSVLATGFASDYWVTSPMGGLTLMANGADVVKSFDGAAIASPAFTGVTLSNLNFVYTYRSRVYFIEANTQKMWYGGVGSVSGALSSFDFSTVASVKGNLKILTSLKGDGGSLGVDNVFVAIFDSGDALAYHGSNPGDATNWSIIGKYKIGRPLSRFGIYSGDDDVYMVSSRGYEKLSELTKYGQSAPDRLLFSDKIQQAVTDAISSVGASEDWQMFLYPRGQMMAVNIPISSGTRELHVRNINTGAWCKFSLHDVPYCWGLRTNQPYFGTSGGKVYKFDDGSTSDNGTTISADGQPAWNNLGYRGYRKNVTLVKPLLTAPVFPAIALGVGADYAPTVTAGAYTTAQTGSDYYWNTSFWDAAYWSPDERPQQVWFSRYATGDAIGVRLLTQVSLNRVKWNLTTILYELGGLL